MQWVIPNKLARSARPGYELGLTPEEVSAKNCDIWLADIKNQGIRSIICLLSGHELKQFTHPSLTVIGGLLVYYESQGFKVYSMPVEPGAGHPLFGEFEKEQLLKTFQLSTKPVLIHCGAGESRTSEAVEYLLDVINL
jgi:hypothetical protein